MREYLFMPDLIEVGKDYIVRPFYIYQNDVRNYLDEDEPTEPPKKYFEMIQAFSEEMIRVLLKLKVLFIFYEKSLKMKN